MSSVLDNNRFEQMIAEAFAAEKAGVFAESRVDVAQLVSPQSPDTQSSRTLRFHERLLVGLPVAACLAAALGIAAFWGVGNENFSSSPLASLSPAKSAETFNARVIVDCMAGPGAQVSEQCGAADFDSDGDVDLLDLGVYQRQVAGLDK